MKVIALMAISADGIIAKSTDEVPWSEDVWRNYFEICNTIGHLVVGRYTYELMLKSDEFDHLKLNKLVVVSEHGIDNPIEGLFIASNPQEAISYLEKEGAKSFVLGGGTKILHSFITQNLIDELLLDVEPILLGTGYPLFGELPRDYNLKLLDCFQSGENTVRLRYEILK